MTDVCNYADDTTSHACDLDFKSYYTGLAIEWFESNCMALNKNTEAGVFLGKGVLKIYSRFTGEHSCRSAISIKFQNVF